MAAPGDFNIDDINNPKVREDKKGRKPNKNMQKNKNIFIQNSLDIRKYPKFGVSLLWDVKEMLAWLMRKFRIICLHLGSIMIR